MHLCGRQHTIKMSHINKLHFVRNQFKTSRSTHKTPKKEDKRVRKWLFVGRNLDTRGEMSSYLTTHLGFSLPQFFLTLLSSSPL